jgi:nucleoside-diphosphate-sugar epimerase
VVYAASSSAYGDTPTLPKVETMTPLPKSPYAVSKLAGEYYCQAFYRVFGLETVCLRYFNIFGPRQNPKAQYAAVVPLFLSSLLRDEPPTIEGDGGQTRDFTFVADCVEANLLACTAADAAGEMINIAGGQENSILDLVRFSQEVTGHRVAPQHVDPRPGDVRRSLADISKAKRLLGWQPRVSLQEGLARVAEWMKQGGG